MKTGAQPVPRRRGTKQTNVAVNDAKASKSGRSAQGRNPSGEGNDPSLVQGHTFRRKVPTPGRG